MNLTGSTPVVTCTGSTNLNVKAALAAGTYYLAVAPVSLSKGMYIIAEVSEFTALWQSAILTDNWNEIEWNMDDWDASLSWYSNSYLNFYMCTSPKGANQNVNAGDAYYIDNIRFGVSKAARAAKVTL